MNNYFKINDVFVQIVIIEIIKHTRNIKQYTRHVSLNQPTNKYGKD